MIVVVRILILSVMLLILIFVMLILFMALRGRSERICMTLVLASMHMYNT